MKWATEYSPPTIAARRAWTESLRAWDRKQARKYRLSAALAALDRLIGLDYAETMPLDLAGTLTHYAEPQIRQVAA